MGSPILEPATKRAQLAQVISHLINERRLDVVTVAKICATSVKEVDRWCAATAIPPPEQWAKLKRGVNHRLRHYGQLWHEAQTEERRALNVGTSLADKLRDVVIPAPTPRPTPVLVPPPVDTMAETHDDPEEEPVLPVIKEEEQTEYGRKLSETLRSLPEGWKSLDERIARREWVRGEFLREPSAAIVHVLARAKVKFGVGVKERDVAAIKREVELVLAAASRQLVAEAQGEDGDDTTAEEKPLAYTADLQTAGQLVLDAIPNLVSFTLLVDKAGQPTLSYTVREVRVVEHSGSFSLTKR